MDEMKGYRLKVGAISDLSRLMDSYRREIMKILARDYARLVARRAVTDLDLVRLGIIKSHPDIIGRASSETSRMMNDKDYVINGRDLNCKIQLYLVENAVLARFLSGNAEYLRLWENRKDVIRWNWSPEGRPSGVTERDWGVRQKIWEAATRKPTLGSGVKFVLVDEALPILGWNGIHRYTPEYDARVLLCLDRLAKSHGQTVATMKKSELEKLRHRVKATIIERPAKENFADPTAMGGGVPAKPTVKVSVTKPAETRSASAKLAMIDHADVVLGNDGRTFVAVPHVGMAADTRVFLQLSGSSVTISQAGILFGTVTNVPRAAIDHLRMCDTVTLVEIEQTNGRRLLRAKHVAIVKDITMFGNAMRPLVGIVRTSSRQGSEETKEWNSAQ
ncbi:hypothetical protein G6L37_03715 [Agrobacterium rubi]|nr:hypothetical protein [Agrobacterium rubi]NTF24459.1 hypothetical protein [Agrobacterium rubi]